MNGPRTLRFTLVLMLFAVLPLLGPAPVDAQERDERRERGMERAREHRPTEARHRVRLAPVNESGIRGMAMFRDADAPAGMRGGMARRAGEKAEGAKERGEKAAEGREKEKHGEGEHAKEHEDEEHEGMRHGEMAHRGGGGEAHGPVRVVLRLTGLTAGSSYPAHIHRGSCESGGPPAVTLEAVTAGEGTTGTSTTELDVETLREMHEDQEQASFFVQVHRPDGAPAACGDVGMPGERAGK